MTDLFPLYNLIVNAFVVIAIVIYIATAKTNSERIRYIVTITGFLAILFTLGDILISQFFIAAWLYLENAPLILPRKFILLFLGVALISELYSATFLAVALLLYLIIIWGFLFGAWKRVVGQVY
jgi:hypothetical protein